MGATATWWFLGYVAGSSVPMKDTRPPSGETQGLPYTPVVGVSARRSPDATSIAYRSVLKSRSQVPCAAPAITTVVESGVHAGPLNSNSPGVRLPGGAEPSAGMTYRWRGRSDVGPSLSSRENK